MARKLDVALFITASGSLDIFLSQLLLNLSLNPPEVNVLKIILILGFSFFESGFISGVGFWLLWLRLPGSRPNRLVEIFCLSFCWKLG